MIISSAKVIIKPSAPPLNNGAVVVRKTRVVSAGPAAQIIRKYPNEKVIHLENSVLLPGLVNLHTHLELPPLLEVIRDKTFPGWVLNLIKAKKKLEIRDYAAAVQKNIETLIRTGTTTVAEICTHNLSPAILKKSGLRAVIFDEVIAMNPASKPELLSRPAFHPPSMINFGISPHAPHTVSEGVLISIKKTATRKMLPLCMHIAESKDETRLLQKKRSGFEKLYQFANWEPGWAPSAPSSFEYLNRIGFLSSRLLAVHAVQIKDKDITLIKRAGVSIAHCPRSNRETGVGRMPLKRFLDAGIIVGLGTDSLASSPTLNMWDEMRYTLKTHKKDAISAKQIFKLATAGGAKALGLQKEIGTLEPGKRADMIAVPLPSKNTGDIYSDLLRETKSCIMTVVNGKILSDRSPKLAHE